MTVYVTRAFSLNMLANNKHTLVHERISSESAGHLCDAALCNDDALINLIDDIQLLSQVEKDIQLELPTYHGQRVFLTNYDTVIVVSARKGTLHYSVVRVVHSIHKHTNRGMNEEVGSSRDEQCQDSQW